MDWLIVGLGNPGKKYENTRHNAGAMVLSEIVAGNPDAFGDGLRMNADLKALTAVGTIGGAKVLLVFPQSYMNLSGGAVAKAVSFYKVEPSRVLAVFDDKDIPLGTLRLRASGSAGGHNGVKSIIERLGTEEFPRLRVGVGTAASLERKTDAADFVLKRPSKAERETLAASVSRAAEAVETILTEGLEAAMNRYN
jgi:PTH1 family peptidyl-tRNA hydrolase